MKPRFDLQLGTDWNNHLDGVQYHDNDAYAMVRMQYNLYHGGADQARISETKLQTLEATGVFNRTKRQVEESTRLSWNALQTAIDRLPKLKEHADASERTRDAYAKQFSIGQRTLLDLLDSENELYTARNDYVDAQYVERFAGYRLMADMGRLLDTLGVAPREESQITSAVHP
jgi:adhesin transport system outer membrane protein